jgi:hypothetical protein
MIYVYKISVGKPEGQRLLVGPRRRIEVNIKIKIKLIGCESLNWIHLAQDRDQWVDCCEHGNEPSGSIKAGKFLDLMIEC